MSDSTQRVPPEQVVELLGVRGALREYRYFVGHRGLLMRLGACIRSGQRGAAWMFGPRRMGKSTLAAKLLSEPRSPARSIWVDAIELPPQDFDGLLDHVVALSCESVVGGSPRARFEALVQGSAERPLAIVFDEFDRIAAELREDQQLFLRRLKEEHPQLSYIFITRADPDSLVEEVSDTLSRLTGVCQILRVTPLEAPDVDYLFQRVADDLGRAAIAPLGQRAWSLVGGYPIAVAVLAQCAATEAAARGDRCTDDDLLDSIERAHAEVRGHLEGLWRDLTPEVRMLLGRDPGPLTDAEREKAQIEGFWSRRVDLVRPEWLLGIGRGLGVAPEPPVGASGELAVNVERLHALVYAVNMHLQRLGYPKGFVATDEIRRQYLLTRSESTRESLTQAIGHLTKVLFTAAGRPKVGASEESWRLPPGLVDAWQACDGYHELEALGGLADRDRPVSADSTRRDPVLEDEGGVFLRHCGTSQPSTAAHWLAVRVGVVRSLVRSLEVLEREAARLPRAEQRTTERPEPAVTIGIVTALAKEFAAMKAALQDCQEVYVPGEGAGRRYVLGRITSLRGGEHRIALALAVGMGNNMAAARATLLREHFPAVEAILMVGIAGAVPAPHKPDDHVRLGDIVISDKRGVVQYDMVKLDEVRACPVTPSARLFEAVQWLQADELVRKRPWDDHIDRILRQLDQVRPDERQDRLHASDDPTQPIMHPKDPKRLDGLPRVFLGPIASANELLKDPVKRDALRNKFGVKAIEMEGSGIADASWSHGTGYLVVRGTCDYCDSHKNDDWQEYAAAVAAGYTRALIESMPVA